MPHLVTKDIKGRDVQVGDIVVLPRTETETSPIATVSVKSKYTWIDGEDGTKGRVGTEDIVTVKRMMPTDEETAERLRELAIHKLTRSMNDAISVFDVAKERYIEKINSGFMVDHWETEKFHSAQASYQIWAQIKNSLDIVEKKTAEAEAAGETYEYAGATIYEIVEDKARRLVNEYVRFGHATSRSTSVVSNAIDDIKTDAILKFINGLQYTGIEVLSDDKGW